MTYSPHARPPDGRFGNDTPEDEHASQAVEEDQKPSAAQQGRYRGDERRDAVQLSQSGAGAEQGSGEVRLSPLVPALGPAGPGPAGASAAAAAAISNPQLAAGPVS